MTLKQRVARHSAVDDPHPAAGDVAHRGLHSRGVAVGVVQLR